MQRLPPDASDPGCGARGSVQTLARDLLLSPGMRVYVLRIEGRARLAQAFDHLMDDPDVESCAIEPG